MRLGGVSQLRVISRTSVIRFREAPPPVQEIARTLDVEAAIEGAVISDGHRHPGPAPRRSAIRRPAAARPPRRPPGPEMTVSRAKRTTSVLSMSAFSRSAGR